MKQGDVRFIESGERFEITSAPEWGPWLITWLTGPAIGQEQPYSPRWIKDSSAPVLDPALTFAAARARELAAFLEANPGLARRLDRINRRLSLREEAKRLGITPSELSALERPTEADQEAAKGCYRIIG